MSDLDLIKSKSFLIAAHALNGVIGHRGGIPWHAPHDLKHFKQMTLGTTMVMGRNTWDSLPAALPGRFSVVVTTRPFRSRHAIAVPSFAEAVDTALHSDPRAGAISFVGGASIYQAALTLPWLRHAYLTEVQLEPEGDTFMPELGPEWRRQSDRYSEPGQLPVCEFVHLTREQISGEETA